MRKLDIPSSPNAETRPTGRKAVIAAIGRLAYDVESGANGRPPEVTVVTPDTAPEVSVEPIRPLTHDEASYVARTLGPAITGVTVERTVA